MCFRCKAAHSFERDARRIITRGKSIVDDHTLFNACCFNEPGIPANIEGVTQHQSCCLVKYIMYDEVLILLLEVKDARKKENAYQLALNLNAI